MPSEYGPCKWGLSSTMALLYVVDSDETMSELEKFQGDRAVLHLVVHVVFTAVDFSDQEVSAGSAPARSC